MELIIKTGMNELILDLREKASSIAHHVSPPVINLANPINFFTVGVTTRPAFGEELGSLQSNSDVHGAIAAMNHVKTTYTI